MTPSGTALSKLAGERGYPPHFAGRGKELSIMDGRLDAMLSDSRSAVEGMLLFSGIPGVGKTQLAKHFIGRRKSKRVKTMDVSTQAAESAEGLIALIGDAMGSEDQFLRAAGIESKVTGARVGVAGVSGGITMDAHRPDVKFFHMLNATKNLRRWRGKALLIVVDEVQNLDSSSAGQMRTLHEGQHGCPIFVVAMGLQHSGDVLSKHGISRMTHHRLEPLSFGEAHSAIHNGLNNIGVSVNEDVAGAYARASMCFPAHVHAYIEAAATVFDAGGGVNSEAAMAEVLAEGRRLREQFYVNRMAAMRSAERLYPLVEHMASNKLEIVTRAAASDIVGDETVAAAVCHGVMATTEDGVLSFAVPSFRAYMINRASQHREIERGRPDNPEHSLGAVLNNK